MNAAQREIARRIAVGTSHCAPKQARILLLQRSALENKEKSMTLLIYLAGWIILIGGVAWGLVALHVAQHTIAIVAVIMLGVAVITGATRVRSRDRS
jgi:hypothetical protein